MKLVTTDGTIGAIKEVALFIVSVLALVIMVYFGPYFLIKDIQSSSWTRMHATVLSDYRKTLLNTAVVTETGISCTIPSYFTSRSDSTPPEQYEKGSTLVVRVRGTNCWKPQSNILSILTTFAVVCISYLGIKNRKTMVKNYRKKFKENRRVRD